MFLSIPASTYSNNFIWTIHHRSKLNIQFLEFLKLLYFYQYNAFHVCYFLRFKGKGVISELYWTVYIWMHDTLIQKPAVAVPKFSSSQEAWKKLSIFLFDFLLQTILLAILSSNIEIANASYFGISILNPRFVILCRNDWNK